MSYTLDSNLLLRSIEADHPQQGEALGLINKLVDRGESVYLLPQVFYEFWVVATRPKGKFLATSNVLFLQVSRLNPYYA